MGTSYNPKIVTDGLVLCLDAANIKSYPGSGTTWADLSGNNVTSALTNSPTFTNSNGGHFTFDGANSYAIASSRTTSMEFQYNSAFTISSFCYITENGGEGYIINNRMSSDSSGTLYAGWGLGQFNGIISGFVGGYPGFFSWRRANISSTTFNSLIFNKWAHIVYLNTGVAGEQKIYINGTNYTSLADEDVNPPYTINYSGGTSRINIGRDGVVTHYLSGRISQISVYNRALSAAEVSQNFEATRGRFGV